MKNIFVFLLAFCSIGYSFEPKLVAGLGMSTYNMPVRNIDSVDTIQYVVGISQSFEVEPKKSIEVVSLYTSNQFNGHIQFSSIELQTLFTNEINDKHSVSIGTQFSSLLSEDIGYYNLDSFGYGFNMTYVYSLSNSSRVSLQYNSMTYTIDAENQIGKFINQTFRYCFQFNL